MKARLGKEAIEIREKLMSEIPKRLKANTGLELTVERPEDGGVFINFYIGRAQFPDNYVGYIGLEDDKPKAYFSIEGCKSANNNDTLCNKGIYELKDRKTLKRCPRAELCDDVRYFIFKYAVKHNITTRLG